MTATATRSRPAVDPRIRQRRVQVKREEGRRRLRILVTCLSALALLAAGWGLTRSPLLDVDRVRVTGTRQTPAAAALAASGIRRGQAMVDVREPAVRRRLEALPWVATARVTRRWPGAVVLALTERAPVAALPAAGGGWALVDDEGRVLERVLAPPAGLPTVGGLRPAGAPGTVLGPDAGGALGVVAALPDAVRPRVSGVTRLGGGELELALAPRGVVRFGPPDRRAAKLAALATVLARVDLRGLAVVDVRVPSAPVVTRQ